MGQFHATTIVAVKRGPDDICIGGDGQVTMGETAIMKNGAKKVKKIYKNSIVTGFAGSVADAFSLTEKFEAKLDEHGGNLKRAAVALAQLWRSDKAGSADDRCGQGRYAGAVRYRRGHRTGSAVCRDRFRWKLCLCGRKCTV